MSCNLIESTLRDFLKNKYNPGRPLLVGISGGPDSLALFYGLVTLGVGPLHVAHIDHGWREESREEGDRLHEWITSFDNVSFYSHRARPIPPKTSPEEWGREERLAFFKKQIDELECQALLLAHHGGDQAETVFKRVVEGASIGALGGIAPVTSLRGMEVWRPFLTLDKKVLIDAAGAQPFAPFEDVTNADPRYHRGKLRQEIFPEMERRLGRAIQPNLVSLGTQMQEMGAYLNAQTARWTSLIRRGPLGQWLDLSQAPLPHRVELVYIVRHFCRMKEVVLSRSEVETAVRLIESGKANVTVGSLLIDRARLFILERSTPQWEVIEEGSRACVGWEAVMKGEASLTLPKGAVELRPLVGRSVSRLLTNHKVPTFLRARVPLIWLDERPYASHLTGRVEQGTDRWVTLRVKN